MWFRRQDFANANIIKNTFDESRLQSQLLVS